MPSYLIFILCSLILIAGSVSNTALAVAFPVLKSSFGTSLIAAGWVISISSLASTAAMPLAGKASDILGRKFIFMLCIFLFTVGSLLSAVATSIEWLIIARLIQGLGAGGFIPASMGLMAEVFPQKRQQMIGLITSIFMIGQIIGPTIGGWLIASYGWRYVFWINIPIGIIALAAAAFLLKPAPRGQGRMDLAGAVLFTGMISGLMLGLSMLGNEDSLSRVWAGLLFALCVLLAFIFVRYENRVDDPIFDLQIIRERPFLASNFYNFLFGMAVIGIFSLIPLYTVSIYGMSILESGLMMMPHSLGVIITSVLASLFMVRWGYRWPMIIGSAGLVISIALIAMEIPGFTFLGLGVNDTTVLVAILLLSGLASGLVAPTANNACIELMPQRVSTISGIRGMCRHAGGALGVTAATLLLHNMGEMDQGFFIIFMGVSAIQLAAMPLILAMPRGPAAERVVRPAVEEQI